MTEFRIDGEDMIKDIYLRISEATSSCNILYCAQCSDQECPEEEDIKNSIYLLTEFLEKIKDETEKYINYCEESGIFNKSESDKPKA